MRSRLRGQALRIAPLEVAMPFRNLPLPDSVGGKLYLSAMLGRHRPFQEDEAEVASAGISAVVRLTEDYETERKAPEYMEAIRRGLLKWEELHFPIADYGIPADIEAYRALLGRILSMLREGRAVLVHCAGGIGRTGTVAASLLICLGYGVEDAIAAVERAGSHAEDAAQVDLLKFLAARHGQAGLNDATGLNGR